MDCDGQRSGVPTRIAAMESVSLHERMKAGAEYRSEPDWRIGARDSNRGLDLVPGRAEEGVNGMMSSECALTEHQTIPAYLLRETVKHWKRKTGEECAPLVR